MKNQYLYCALLGVIIIFSLTSCVRDRQQGIDGYLYTEEEIFIKEDTNINPSAEKQITNLKYSNGYLYYCRGRNTLFRHSLNGTFVLDGGTEDAVDELIMTAVSDKSLLDYGVDKASNVYYFLGNKKADTAYNSVMEDGTLYKQSADGTMNYELSVSLPPMGTYSLQIAIDAENQVLLLLGDAIFIIDEKGQISHQLDLSLSRPEHKYATEELLEGEAGRIYYCADSSLQGGQLTVYEIIKENNSFHLEQIKGNDWEQQGIGNGKLYGSPLGLLYSSGDRILRRYDQEDASWRKLLRWSDSNLTDDPGQIIQFSEENIVVFYPYTGGQSGQSLYLLTKTEADQVPEKEELIMACSNGVNQTMEECVAAFNRSSSRYHVTIEIYQNQEGALRLDSELVSSNPPDLLNTMNMDILKYADKQTLEDLRPYLENSDVLNKDNFLDNVLKGYTIKEKLICIPRLFSWNTVCGRTSQLGKKSGWTMEEVIDWSAQYPEYKLFGYNTPEYILTYLCDDYIMNKFIDWEQGKCSFGSDEFQSLIQWAEKYSEQDNVFTEGDVSENVLLMENYIISPFSFLNFEANFGEELTAIGYPSLNGQVRHRAQIEDALCITAKSRHKEGAWAFIEYLLGPFQEEKGDYYDVFSTRRDLLAKMMEDMAAVDYVKDEKGERIITDQGPVRRIKGKRLENGTLVNYYSIPQAELDDMMEIIENIDFTPRGGAEAEVLTIITEELHSYLNGNKTLDEITEIIQNRVQILVQERD